LHQEIANIGWVFPDESANEAVAATRNIVVGMASSVERHLANDEQTDGVLQLRGNREMPVALLGPEPLLAVEDLRLAYWMLGQVEANPDMAAVLTNSEDGRRIWHFVDTSGKLPPCASMYVRPRGSSAVDPKYDYGVSSGYAPAKWGFNVDVDTLREWFVTGDAEPVAIERAEVGAYTNIALRNELEPTKAGRGRAHDRALENGESFVPMHDIAALNGSGRAKKVGQLVAYSHDIQSGGASSHIHLEGIFPEGYDDPAVFENHILAVEAKVTKNLIREPAVLAAKKARRPEVMPGGLHEFQIGDNPYDIGGGALRVLAHSAGIELGSSPTDDEIRSLFRVMGSEHVFRRNVATVSSAMRHLSQAQVAAMVHRTGVTTPMTLRSVEGATSITDFEHGLLSEATVGWMERRLVYLSRRKEQGIKIGSILLAASDRPLNTPTEISHPKVVALYKELGRMPTAVDYMERAIAPGLAAAGLALKDVVSIPHQLSSGENSPMRRSTAQDLARATALAHPEVANGAILLAQNAPANWTFWQHLQVFRKELNIGSLTFDDRTQFVFGGNDVQLAERPVELASGLYQNPWTAVSAIPRFVKAINDINRIYTT
jgi:hypothetical protein